MKNVYALVQTDYKGNGFICDFALRTSDIKWKRTREADVRLDVK